MDVEFRAISFERVVKVRAARVLTIYAGYLSWTADSFPRSERGIIDPMVDWCVFTSY